jgi:hypothetical protein
MSESAGRRWFAQAGGVGPKFPVEGPRKRPGLTLEEREEIQDGVGRNESIWEIARRLGRSPSTIMREIDRNAFCRGRYRARYRFGAKWRGGWEPTPRYRANAAQWRAQQRAQSKRRVKRKARPERRPVFSRVTSSCRHQPGRSALPGHHQHSQCFRWCRAARASADRKSRCRARWHRRWQYGWPSPCPDPRSGFTQDRRQLRFAHAGLLMLGDPDCQRCPSVLQKTTGAGGARTRGHRIMRAFYLSFCPLRELTAIVG